MKNTIKVLGAVVISAIVMTTLIACGPPSLRGTVTIDGDPLVGNTLTANTSSLGGSGIISYQWMRNGGTVDGMIGTTYTLQRADRDAVITVTVIRSDNSGSVTSAPVTIFPPPLSGTVRIVSAGNTLTANTSSLGGSGTISYQWMRNGNTVDGVTGTTHTLRDADKNTVITLTVTRLDNAGSVTSAPVNILGYLIGERGPGGGIIFYQDFNGFTMTDTGQKAYYLEAAPSSQGNLAWASSGFTQTSIAGTGSAIGTGRRNTALILARDANAPAALACKNYRSGGKNDWFLPSSGELSELYKQRRLLGISSTSKWEWFWTSAQTTFNNRIYASVQNFGFGDIPWAPPGETGVNYMGNANNVRAVRAF